MIQAEFQTKLQRVRDFICQNGFDGVLYGNNENFCWLSCGHYAFVDKGSSAAVAKLLITGDNQYVICNSSEKYRIPEEELAHLPFELVAYDWHDSEQQVIEQLINGKRIASDNGAFGTVNCAQDLIKLRYVLTEQEITRYRDIGPLAAEVVEDCCREIKTGVSEYEIAGSVTGRLMALGFQVPVCLVAADDRLLKYRHPLPTAKTVERTAMIAICTQKYGLTVSMSRIVSFGEPDALTAQKFDAVTKVDAVYILSTVAGTKAGDIVKKGHAMYEQTGFEKDFHLHHQGGALGYLTRDYCANEENDSVVLDHQAFSWNPTIAGVKSEDTFLVFGDTQEIISKTSTWPQRSVTINGKTILRPDILVK